MTILFVYIFAYMRIVVVLKANLYMGEGIWGLRKKMVAVFAGAIQNTKYTVILIAVFYVSNICLNKNIFFFNTKIAPNEAQMV